jgi:hypothetical protein
VEPAPDTAGNTAGGATEEEPLTQVPGVRAQPDQRSRVEEVEQLVTDRDVFDGAGVVHHRRGQQQLLLRIQQRTQHRLVKTGQIACHDAEHASRH